MTYVIAEPCIDVKDLSCIEVCPVDCVETPLDHLRNGHVDEIQGFLLSKPLDPQALETQLLAATRPSTPTT